MIHVKLQQSYWVKANNMFMGIHLHCENIATYNTACLIWGFCERNQKLIKYKGIASALISAMCHCVALANSG